MAANQTFAELQAMLDQFHATNPVEAANLVLPAAVTVKFGVAATPTISFAIFMSRLAFVVRAFERAPARRARSCFEGMGSTRFSCVFDYKKPRFGGSADGRSQLD